MDNCFIAGLPLLHIAQELTQLHAYIMFAKFPLASFIVITNLCACIANSRWRHNCSTLRRSSLQLIIHDVFAALYIIVAL